MKRPSLANRVTVGLCLVCVLSGTAATAQELARTRTPQEKPISSQPRKKASRVPGLALLAAGGAAAVLSVALRNEHCEPLPEAQPLPPGQIPIDVVVVCHRAVNKPLLYAGIGAAAAGATWIVLATRHTDVAVAPQSVRLRIRF